MGKKILVVAGFCLAVFLITNLLGSGKKENSLINRADKSNSEAAAQKAADEKRKIEEYRQQYSLKETNTAYNDFMIQAKSGIVADAQTGEILYAKDEHKKLAPASITKIMAAIIALENIDINKKIEISKRASMMQAFKINMSVGEKMATEDLLYAAMMISANDAAEALAEGIDGKKETFIEKMNEKVRLLELKETSFKNTCGLDESEHTSSAYDMAKITYYALKSRPEILKYMGEKDPYSVPATKDNQPHYWDGHVSLTMRSYPEMLGAKTGFTDNARNTFVGVAQKNGKKFIFVFMGSDRGNEDAKALLSFGLSKI